MSAFMVTVDEVSRVVFAEDEEAATWAGLEGADLDSGVFFRVERAPLFDAYEQEGRVPLSVLLDNGLSLSAEELGGELVALIRLRDVASRQAVAQ